MAADAGLVMRWEMLTGIQSYRTSGTRTETIWRQEGPESYLLRRCSGSLGISDSLRKKDAGLGQVTYLRIGSIHGLTVK